MSTNSRPRWYVIKCKHRQEHRALEHLERQGFPCYLPELSVERLKRACRTESREPLFPGYLFIQLDNIHDNWYPIRSTRGVSQIVRFNEHPLPVQDDLIDTIRQRLASDPSTIPYLQPGQLVRIIEGPFSQLEAVFVAIDGDERVVVLMSILRRDQLLRFPMAIVRKCANQERSAEA